MSLSEISIKNPVFAWMLMIGLMLFGYLSFRGMGVGQMPDVDFPVLTVEVTWEGAAPEVMESDVVDIIEDAVTGVQGLREVTSSTRQGQATITLEFDLERDIDVALQEVQSKVSGVQRRLPEDIDPPVITKANPEDQPIMWLAVSADESYSLRDLMEYVDRSLKDHFKTVPGVSEVFLSGFVDRNLRVWIDKDKLEQYQLTVTDVMQAIQEEHVETPAGRIETSERESNVRAMGEAASTQEFEKIMIQHRGGQPIYRPIQLKEVARIEDGLADVRRISRVMGKQAVGLGIKKQRGMNSVAVAKEVRKRMTDLQPTLPKGVSLGLNFDSTKFIEEAVDELVFTLLLSALFTSIVCWMFLGSLSSTLNILLAIPTSILGTFMVIRTLGFTLNTFTLLGLSLAIGIVVDDAIMVLENIVRHREMGKEKVKAALEGSKEITFAALAATIAVTAIFLPVAYMKGIIGKFFFQFGLTISTAVFISLLEALTLTPMRCSEFLNIEERKSKFGRFFENSLVRGREFYRKTLIIALNHKKKVLIGSVIFFIATLQLLPHIRKEFVPAQDQSMFLMRLKLPTGSAITLTNERFKEIEKVIMARPEVKRYFSAVGGFGGGEVNAGQLFITLKEPKDRPADKVKGRRLRQEEIMEAVRKDLKQFSDVQVVVQDLSMRGFSAKRGFPIEFSVLGPNWDKLVEYSEKIADEMEKNNLFRDVDTDYVAGMPEVRIYPDRDKAFDRGVSISTVAQTVNALIGGERVGKYTKDGRRYDVRVRLIADQRMKKEDIEKLKVWNNRGEMVQLGAVVRVQEKPSLLAITRKDRERAIGVFANVGEGQSQAVAIKKAQQISASILPSGYHAVLSGTSQTMGETFGSLLFALLLGIVVAYMVLASQFNHLIHPFTVLLALPFSISGAFIALWMGGYSLNIFSMIGLLLLMGIVKKNSILLVEFTNQVREHKGLPTLEALIEACPIRFRPIIMTSVATIAAAVPPALALGPGAETRIPMAAAVIGGVLVSTLLTFYVVPAAYLTLAPLEKRETTRHLLNSGKKRLFQAGGWLKQGMAKWIKGAEKSKP